jgi:hypothetical protein
MCQHFQGGLGKSKLNDKSSYTYYARLIASPLLAQTVQLLITLPEGRNNSN